MCAPDGRAREHRARDGVSRGHRARERLWRAARKIELRSGPGPTMANWRKRLFIATSYITADAAQRATKEPVVVVARAVDNEAPYFVDYLGAALDESFPYVSAAMNKIGQECGWPPMARADYDAAASLRGSNFVGTPEHCVGAYLFLASEALSGYITGQISEVNGGQLMP